MRLLTLFLLVFLAGCSNLRLDKAAWVASSFTSYELCSASFISHENPDAAYEEMIRHLPGMELVDWGLRYRVDTSTKMVSTSIAGIFSTRSYFREGLGCVGVFGDDSGPPALIPSLPEPRGVALLPPIAGPMPVQATDSMLAKALASAFPGAGEPDLHHTKALVVLRSGKLIGERYAPGIGIGTQLPGFSMTKSVTQALVGILVQKGRLTVDGSAPIDAWQSASDPRHAISLDILLRQTSGLDLPQDNSGFDRTSQIMWLERDKAGASAQAGLAVAPGTRWNYSDTNYMLLGRILRDAVGGSGPSVLGFAESELFEPLGMQDVTLPFDLTGTPMGAAGMFASARDWARFGQLYLDDGIVAGRRILPEGWVAYSSTTTLDTGYGAGFWTNRKPGLVPGWGVPWGLPHAPPDTYFARGFMGQFTIMIPSLDLVIVRLSSSNVRGDDIGETDRIVGAILDALAASARS